MAKKVIEIKFVSFIMTACIKEKKLKFSVWDPFIVLLKIDPATIIKMFLSLVFL